MTDGDAYYEKVEEAGYHGECVIEKYHRKRLMQYKIFEKARDNLAGALHKCHQKSNTRRRRYELTRVVMRSKFLRASETKQRKLKEMKVRRKKFESAKEEIVRVLPGFFEERKERESRRSHQEGELWKGENKKGVSEGFRLRWIREARVTVIQIKLRALKYTEKETIDRWVSDSWGPEKNKMRDDCFSRLNKEGLADKQQQHERERPGQRGRDKESGTRSSWEGRK